MNGMEYELRLQRPTFTLDVDLHLPGQALPPCLGLRAAARQPCCAQWQDWNEPTQAGSRCTVRCGKTMPRGVASTHERALGYVFQELACFTALACAAISSTA